MKKQLALATAALMALSLAACGNTATASSAAESTSTAASIFRIDETFLIKEAAHEIFL